MWNISQNLITKVGLFFKKKVVIFQIENNFHSISVFRRKFFHYDVAMITLPKPFNFNAKVNAACLPNDLRIFDEIIDNTWNGLEFTITGFGPINGENDFLPKLGFAQHSKKILCLNTFLGKRF